MNTLNLTHHFLIAMPAMQDANFARSVVYLCEHSERGAMGLIINRPLELNIGSLFRQLDLKDDQKGIADLPVYFGGPVQTDRGFVLHQPLGNWQSTLAVREESGLGLTTSRDILQAMGSEEGPDKVLLTLGYAGWEAGQLEEEIALNAWLTVEADLEVLFSVPPKGRFDAAMALLGIDLTYLSDQAGHA